MLPIPETSPAVVPIFVNAGAALFPAIIAGFASVAAIIMKPKELVAAFKRKPWMPFLVIAIGAGLWFGGSWAFGPHQAVAATTGTTVAGEPTSKTDWAAVALDILRRDKTGGKGPIAGMPGTGSATTSLLNPGGLTSFNGTIIDPTTGNVITDGNGAATGAASPYILGMGVARTAWDGSPGPRGLAKFWSYSEDNSTSLSSPLLVGNKLYSSVSVLKGGAYYGSVICLDAESGTLIWKTSAGNDGKAFPGIFSSPAVTADGANLLIGLGLHPDMNCSLVCMDAVTGAIRWQAPSTLHIESSPAIWGDIAVVGCGAIEGPDHKPISAPGEVIAVQISDGTVLWRHPVNDPESSPAIVDGIVYIGSGFNGNKVVAIKLEGEGAGNILWSADTTYPATGAITVVGDIIITGVGNGDFVYADKKNPAGKVLAINRADGKVVWSKDFPDAVLGAVAVVGNVAVCTGRTGKITLMNIADGSIIKSTTAHESEPVMAAAAFTGKTIYAVSSGGYLVVLDGEGKKLETIALNSEDAPGQGMSFSSPTVAGGRVFVGSETGGLICLVGTSAE